MTDSFDHIVYVYGRTEGSAVRFDHELQDGEVIEFDGRPMRVIGTRTEERDYRPIRIARLEAVTREEP